AVWLCDLGLTCTIVARVPFTNIDWESYMAQVDGVLAGQFDYSQLSSPTGPIAYPAGYCWLYAGLRLLRLEIMQVQILFGLLYLGTIAMVLQIYRRAEVPGWLLALCVLSKRVHSVYVLRLFNDAVSQFFMYAALLLFLKGRHFWSSLGYSFAATYLQKWV
ncbi:unnamed protein product, partial [Polarella glacialis]